MSPPPPPPPVGVGTDDWQSERPRLLGVRGACSALLFIVYVTSSPFLAAHEGLWMSAEELHSDRKLNPKTPFSGFN